MVKKHHLIAIMFMGAALAIPCSRADENWLVDAANGCRIWNPHPVAGEYIEWYGPLTTNTASGYGIAIWKIDNKESERVAGQWKNGRLNGVAVWDSSTGAQYAGEWKNGVKDGYGIFTNPDGSIFIGEYENDQPLLGRKITTEGTRELPIETAEIRAIVYRSQDAAIRARKAAAKAAAIRKSIRTDSSKSPPRQP